MEDMMEDTHRAAGSVGSPGQGRARLHSCSPDGHSRDLLQPRPRLWLWRGEGSGAISPEGKIIFVSEEWRYFST